MATSKLQRKLARVKQRLGWAVQNLRGAARFRAEVAGSSAPLADLTRYERRIYSQNGEDGILQAIFARVGTTNKYLVEFGIGSGRECNTRYLVARQKWTGLWMTGNVVKKRAHGWTINREFITAENIQALFEKYGVPRNFDLLSIDIDGNDYWLWKKITGYRPRVVIMEYNADGSARPGAHDRGYEPEFVWRKTDYMGASLLALEKLGRAKGYTLIGCDSWGANAFFVLDELAHHFR